MVRTSVPCSRRCTAKACLMECGVIGLQILQIQWAFLALSLHRGSGDVLVWPIARKEPVLRSFRSPPGTQDLQELRREHYITVFLSLALFDPQDHALAVDGGRRKRDSFRDAQAGSVASGQNGTMLPAGNAGKKLNDFLGTEDH